MTVLTATLPVFLHLLADRHGSPAGLLCEVAAPAAPAAHGEMPVDMLRELAHGRLPCFYRAALAPSAAEVLDQCGWRVLAPEQVLRLESAPEQAPAPGVQWLEGDWCMAPPPRPAGAQVASRALAMQLVQLVSADADTHEIEAVLRQDPTLSYHLLRVVNSLGMGASRRVTSFSQALLILGRSQLRRWLNLMLFSSRQDDKRSPMLLARVSVRARAMELLAHDTGLGKAQQEQAFMVGMFSLLGVLFGTPLAEVLKPLTIADAVLQALLAHDGELGQLLALLEAAEQDDHPALQQQLAALQIDGATYNRTMTDAWLWMQGVVISKTGDAGTGHA